MGICKRTDVGKIRHLDTRLLWVQDKVRWGEIELEKIAWPENPADAFTKYLGAEALMSHLGHMGRWPAEGRARTAPAVYEAALTFSSESFHTAGAPPTKQC